MKASQKSTSRLAELRRRYDMELPRWRHPLFGYVLSFPLVGLALLAVLLENSWLPRFYFPSAAMFCVIVVVAFLWGVGPALFSLLLSIVALDYFYLPPRGALSLNSWDGFLQILPLVIAGLIVVLMAVQSERARRRARFAEQVAQERADEMEAIFETMTNGVVAYDSEGHILHMNAAFRKLIGLAACPDYTSYPSRERSKMLVMRDEHGQMLPEEQWPVNRMLRGEDMTEGNAIDILVRTLDGREVQLNVSWASSRNLRGGVTGGVIIYRDVTERRQAEQRNRQVLDALLALAESLVEISHEVDAAREQASDTSNWQTTERKVAHRLAELICQVLGCQRISISLVEPETELLRAVAVVGLSADQEQQWWKEQRERESRLGDSPMPELVSRLKANEVLIIDMRQPPFSQQPNPYGATLILIAPMFVGEQLVGLLALDHGGAEHQYTPEEIALVKAVAKLAALVIERGRLLHEQAEAQARELALREANRRMDEFIGIASHELKTPLSSIKGNIQLVERRLHKNLSKHSAGSNVSTQTLEGMQNLIGRADRQVNRMTRLINDLLDVSRIQENRLKFDIEPVDLVSIVRDAVQEQRQVSYPRQIALELPAEGPVQVMADMDRIEQVVTNYLTNALKYSETERPVDVRLEVDGQVARVSVRDEGPGLSIEDQARVWERFYRVPGIEVQKGSEVGLGLGLHISRTIIEQHGAQVGVESTPGRGSTFWFTLPLR